ncbi:ComEC/Rec2 family competence protein [Corynebacterium sp.]|uniref:ComEC/Rec2 family competence protein n=1 Tax=Corynebacterium sp. TaxID=1720 RepID=UPI0025BE60B2|nr:ComEC/Rec2 family competence protein [Corynebacterium sp.]
MSDLSERHNRPDRPDRPGRLYPDPDLTPAPGTGRAWTVPDRDPHSPAALRRRRGPDLRLAPVALTVWLAVTLTVVTRTPWPLLVTGTPVLITALVVVVRRWGRRRRRRPGLTGTRAAFVRTGVLAGLCAAVWSARAAWLVHRADRHPWLTGTSRRFTGVLELVGAPKRLTGGSLLAPVDVPGLGTVPLFISPDGVPGDTPAGSSTVTDPLAVILDLQPGSELAVTATVRASDRPGIAPVTLSAVSTPEPADGPDGISAVTAHLRDGLRDAASHLPDAASDLVPGMVVGDVGGQDPATRTEFLATGLSHLTAVSGANLAIVSGGVLVLAGALGAGKRVQVFLAAACLTAFVVLVGPEPSVLRAAVMGLVGLVAVFSARRTHGFAACSAAVLLLLLIDPGLAVEYAFILSVVATVGIVAVAQLISRRLLQYWTGRRADHRTPVGWQRNLCQLIGVSLAADVVTAPVIAHMTGVISPTAVMANLLAGPAVPVVTVVGMVGALLAGAWVPAGAAVLWICAPCAMWITQVAHTLARVPVLSATAGWWAVVAVATVGTALVTVVVSARWRSTAVGVLSVALVVGAAAWRSGSLTAGPYPTPAVTPRFGAGIDRTWAENLDDVTGWRIGVRWTDDGPELLSPGDNPGETDDNTDPTVQVVTVADDESVLRHEQAASGTGTRRPELYVVTACGRSRGMPSMTPVGVPVAYPCRDGTVLLAGDGLHASGRG